LAWLVTAVVLLHAVILLAHDSAHRDLGVALVLWQTIFVYLVIVAGPLLAAALAFTRRARSAYALLAVTMLGSFVFGAFHHYVAISPDHVAHLPAGAAQPLFKGTAALMAGVEALAAAFGAYAYAKSRRA
jgi:hypothetical protein